MFGPVKMKSIVLNICSSKCIQISDLDHFAIAWTYSNSLYFRINFVLEIHKWPPRVICTSQKTNFLVEHFYMTESKLCCKHLLLKYMISPYTTSFICFIDKEPCIRNICTSWKGYCSPLSYRLTRIINVIIHLVEFSGLFVKQIRTLELVSIFIFRR